MRLTFPLIACTALLPFSAAPALANDPVTFKSRAKAALASISPQPQAKAPAVSSAPFVPYVRDDFPENALRVEVESRDVPNSCSSADSASLCYDYKRGRAVYKPTRNWMPDVPGMRAESITVKRDKIAFNYSFK